MSAEGAPLAVWSRLRQDPRTSTTGDVPSVETGIVTSGGAVRLALGPEGEARLLIPLAGADAFPRVADAGGLLLQDVWLMAPTRTRYLDITCRRPALERVFSDLSSDVLRRLTEGESPALALDGAIRDFRELLLRAAAGDISFETALGLIGELVVLNDLLARDPLAWTGWTGGTFSARHDFRAGVQALEVKSGLRGPLLAVTISGVDQLREPEGGRLHLIHVIVERDPSGQLHAERLAGLALARASDPEAVLELLADRDYHPALADAWAPYRFSLFRRDVYQVRDGFPRLILADFVGDALPQGVSHFQYRVDLSAASDYRVTPDDQDGVLASFVEALA